MPYILAVASSCIVIWKQPSPSMLITVASGRPTFAPIAAGTPKPIVPRPPEVSQCRGRSMLQVLGRPHLVLADAGRPDHVAVGGQVAQPLDHVLRLQRLRVAVAERVLAASTPRTCVEPLARPSAGRRSSRDCERLGQLRHDQLQRAHDRDLRRAGSCRSRPGRRPCGSPSRRARTRRACRSRGRRSATRRRSAGRPGSAPSWRPWSRACRAGRCRAGASRGTRPSPSASSRPASAPPRRRGSARRDRRWPRRRRRRRRTPAARRARIASAAVITCAGWPCRDGL